MDVSPTDKILVVDDSPDDIFFIKTILEEEGYAVTATDNGPAALAKITTSIFDLILLNAMMPGIDSYEVTERIRTHPTTSMYLTDLTLLLSAVSRIVIALSGDSQADLSVVIIITGIIILIIII